MFRIKIKVVETFNLKAYLERGRNGPDFFYCLRNLVTRVLRSISTARLKFSKKKSKRLQNDKVASCLVFDVFLNQVS